jgi:hypothetical protein
MCSGVVWDLTETVNAASEAPLLDISRAGRWQDHPQPAFLARASWNPAI